MNMDKNFGVSRVLAICSEYFGLSRAWSLAAVGFIAVVTSFAIFWFVHAAPPRVLTITSGPPGSALNGMRRGMVPSWPATA